MKSMFSRSPDLKVSALRAAICKANRYLVQGVSIAALAAAGATVEAAEKKKDEKKIVEEIVVKGFRGSLIDAVRAKRNADNVMDSISAEDIGKLSDTNIAEALQRVTGVQIQRENGEGAFISVRGLDPTLTKVTVNGQSLTAARSRAGQTGFNLSILGASGASALEVIKSPTADMEEGGVGGSVNIRKLRPFDHGEFKLNTSVEGVYEEQRGSTNPRVNVFYNDIFADDTFGLSLQAYYYNREFQRTRVRGEGPDGNGAFFYQDRLRPRLNQDEDENINLSGTFQWRVSEDMTAYAELTYGTTDGIDRRYDTELRFSDEHINFTDPVLEANDDGFITTMPVSDFRSLNFGGFSNTTEDNLYVFASGVDWDLNDRVNLKIEGAYSRNDLVNDDLPSFGGSVDFTATGDTLAILRFDDSSESGVSIEDVAGVINFGSVSVADLGSSFGSNGSVQENLAEEYSIKADVEYTLDNGEDSIQFGFKYTNRTEEQSVIRRNYISAFRARAALDAVEMGDSILRRFDDYVSLFPGLGTVTGVDVRDIGLGLANNPDAFTVSTDGVDDELFAERSVFAAYALTRFTVNKDSMPIRGNVGVRVVHTSTDTSGFGEAIGSDGGGDDRVSFDEFGNPIGFIRSNSSKNEFEILPSMNFAMELNDNSQVRLAVARVMRRPEIRELTPFFEIDLLTDPVTGDIDFTAQALSGEAGNPDLDPFLANQLDITYEYYLGDEGLISAGIFYKDVENFITQGPVFTQRDIIAPDGTETTVDVAINSYMNGGAAEVRGIELAYQQAFSFLPEPFNDLGTSINYTFTDSEEETTGRQLDGTSENTFNATLFYENERFGGRVAYNLRDTFRTSGSRYRDELDQIDASFFYNINDKLKVTFNVVNLTDEPFLRDFEGSSNFLESDLSVSDISNNFRDYELSGRQFFLGVAYSY